VAGAAL